MEHADMEVVSAVVIWAVFTSVEWAVGIVLKSAAVVVPCDHPFG